MIKCAQLTRPKQGCDVEKFGYENAKKVIRFHESFPEYQRTPLVELDELAKKIGIESFYVKDESYRFGLNAFKVLGGSYALGSYIAEVLKLPMENMTCAVLKSDDVKNKVGDVTFITTTDGNHGRGVAWTAKELQQKSVVYMPKGSAEERLENIQALGADACITELSYDDAVRKAAKDAEENGWILVQDTAWEGYEKIPTWIMQGYTTMAHEAVGQMKERELAYPTHIFLQAGVGAMSGAITGYFADLFKDCEEKPKVIIVEPNHADCIYKTAAANDGSIHVYSEEMNTIMAGLACGEPCTIGWEVLHDHADYFLSVPDSIAAKGMRVLGNPIGQDKKVISGESGAVTTGILVEIMTNPELEELKKQLELSDTSRVFCISTEGDTDQENYRRIVWDGAYPSI